MLKRDRPIELRLALPEEREALEELQWRASLALPDYREQLLANPDAIHLPAAKIDAAQVIVAEVDGAVAGFATLEGGELDGLFVEPSHWRSGVGAALVEAAAHDARRHGLTLTVVASPSARAFYERCGFSYEGEEATRFGPALRMSR